MSRVEAPAAIVAEWLRCGPLAPQGQQLDPDMAVHTRACGQLPTGGRLPKPVGSLASHVLLAAVRSVLILQLVQSAAQASSAANVLTPGQDRTGDLQRVRLTS